MSFSPRSFTMKNEIIHTTYTYKYLKNNRTLYPCDDFAHKKWIKIMLMLFMHRQEAQVIALITIHAFLDMGIGYAILYAMP